MDKALIKEKLKELIKDNEDILVFLEESDNPPTNLLKKRYNSNLEKIVEYMELLSE